MSSTNSNNKNIGFVYIVPDRTLGHPYRLNHCGQEYKSEDGLQRKEVKDSFTSV